MTGWGADMGLPDCVQKMLERRNLPKPDGRWLYAYRLSSHEYETLRHLLTEAVRATQVQVLAHRNRHFAALFVLYASEWWRREYDGGPWRWGPILASLQITEGSLAPNDRSEMVVSGFAFWGLRPTREGKRYFGTVVAQGGLPLKLIGQGGSRLSAVMGTILRQAARYGWSEIQVVDAVADHANVIPSALRHEEMYRLFASMALTTLNLRARHKLSEVVDPIAHLNSVEPDWREEYPLQIDDAAAVQLLTSMVQAASVVSTEKEASVVFQVVRYLSFVGLDEWQIESRIVHPAVAAADALARQAGLGTASTLPRYFEVDATICERRALTSGRLLLGSANATVALGVQRHRWSGPEACEEHILHLRAAGCDLLEGGASLPGGESLTDFYAPWAFIAEGERFQLAGVGDLRLPDTEAVVAIAKGSVLEALESGVPDAEPFGRLCIGTDKTLDLWRVSGSVLISDNNDCWRILLGQTRKLSSSLVLEGRRAAYPSRPWPVFRGRPQVMRF